MTNDDRSVYYNVWFLCTHARLRCIVNELSFTEGFFYSGFLTQSWLIEHTFIWKMICIQREWATRLKHIVDKDGVYRFCQQGSPLRLKMTTQLENPTHSDHPRHAVYLLKHTYKHLWWVFYCYHRAGGHVIDALCVFVSKLNLWANFNNILGKCW